MPARSILYSVTLAAATAAIVAAQPRGGVGRPEAVAQPVGDGAQHHVADVVAVLVVDRLEAVQVEVEHRGPGVGAVGDLDGLARAVEEEHACPDVDGEIVVAGEVVIEAAEQQFLDASLAFVFRHLPRSGIRVGAQRIDHQVVGLER